MATHTGIDLYSCPFCTRTFKSHANMHNHKKKMHPNKWVRKYTQPTAAGTASGSAVEELEKDALDDEQSEHAEPQPVSRVESSFEYMTNGNVVCPL